MASSSTEHRILDSGRFSRTEAGLPGGQQAHLTNGRYDVTLDRSGTGFSKCDGMAVTHLSLDLTSEAVGFFVYLRDLDDQAVWSAGFQPVRQSPTHYEFHDNGKLVSIIRVDHEIETKLTVCIAPNHNVEVRRCRITNLGRGSRRIEVTSYVEFVLDSHQSHASHPTFSKIFLQTRYLEDSHAILVTRRPRSVEAPRNWCFHRLLLDESVDDSIEVQFETNRARFIGRGRTLTTPRALDPGESLSGDQGSVLDPIGSLRAEVHLKPGGTKELFFLLGASRNPDDQRMLLDAIGSHSEATAVLDEAAAGTDASNDEPAFASRTLSRGSAGQIVVHPPHESEQSVSFYDHAERRYQPASKRAENLLPPSDTNGEALQFDNGYGGFSADGREYVIRLRRNGRGHHVYPPQPWCNVIANEQAGFLVTEAGAGHTWSGNSRLNRLTESHNDPVCDTHAEALWIRDEDAGEYWSPTPRPTPAAADYTVRHGFGYTTFECSGHELGQEITMFMPHDAPVKLTRIRFENHSDRTRRLSLFAFARWVLGDLPDWKSKSIETRRDAERPAILAVNPDRECYQEHVAFSALVTQPEVASSHLSFTGDRGSFLGRHRDLSEPWAVTDGDRLNNQVGPGLDPCAAWQVSLEIAPGEAFEAIWILGETDGHDQVGHWIDRFSNVESVEEALSQTRQSWHDTLSTVQIETPFPEIDLMANGWLVYQNLSCRLWGRSAYYQPGGAFGFRDQLQDAASLILLRPDLTRKQILRHAAQQFVEGDVLHWWHPDTGYGLRTRFSDDLLWLPYVTATYVRATGDDDVLEERVPYITDRQLTADEQEVYLRPRRTPESGTVYDHCCRALDRGLTVGQHGLPLIGSGDWNDGMNRIGAAGAGESVWLGFFICHVLECMLPILRQRKDQERVDRYTAYGEQLRKALNTAGWDGSWYRRAYYDDGQPVGSSSNEECQIDVLAQAWAVLSRVAPPERAEMAIRSVHERLVDTDTGIIRLLTPPFNQSGEDPGYIKGYLPGVRENGGQYTHGALWFIRCLAEMGRGNEAVELLRMLSPVSHASSRQRVEIYQTEPYVVAADVYSEPPHKGRGGWTWYTGSAGWMYRVTIESVFGLSLNQGDTLELNPCISSSWPRCRLRYRLPDGATTYEITIENPHGKESGVVHATLDGCDAAITEGKARIPLQFDQGLHRVSLRL